MGFVELNLTGIIQLLNFLILLFVLYKFLYKPFLQIADKRREKIQSDLASAEKELKEAQEMKKQAHDTLESAKKSADGIISEARQKSEEIINQAKVKAREEAEKVLNSARNEIEREKKQALQEIEKRAGEIAVTLALKILQGVLDEKAKREYLINILNKEKEK